MMEKVFRSRIVRASFAATLVAAGLWGFSPYVLSDVAKSAYVNAELKRVTTPIAGVLTDGVPQEGAYLAKDDKLELVTARTPDRSRLDDLTRETALADSTVSLMETQLAELQQEDANLRGRSAVFKAATLEYMGGRAREGQAQVAECRARQNDQELKLSRARRLAEHGFISDAGLKAAEAAAEEASQNCKSASAALDSLHAQDAAARRGVYLNDGNNDAPYAEQQRGRLMIRRQELTTELVKARSTLAQLQAQLGEEQRRYERTVHYQTVLPAGHIVWNVEARPGSEVAEGQALVDLADCQNRFVVVELPARKIEHLSVGDPARVRLLGSGTWTTGRVRRITGGAAKQETRLFAADVPKPSTRDFTVEVGLEARPGEDGRRSCELGRLADVRFGGPWAQAGRAFAALDGRGPY